MVMAVHKGFGHISCVRTYTRHSSFEVLVSLHRKAILEGLNFGRHITMLLTFCFEQAAGYQCRSLEELTADSADSASLLPAPI